MKPEDREGYNIVKTLYLDNNGAPILLTEGQTDIFEAIFYKENPRNHIMTFTRYGKSLVVALAVLTRAATFPEKWAIVAGTRDKARIIMNYIIQHIFDTEYTRSKFVIAKGESEENIRRYRNKTRINFKTKKGLGEIYICSAREALGFGAPNIVEDEAAFVEDQEHSLVMRMLGDNPNNFLCKIGNPYRRNHFLRSYEDERYRKITVDYRQGVKEGRFTEEQAEEMKKEYDFGILYECLFPKADAIDKEGWTPLFGEDEVRKAMVSEGEPFGNLRLGVDMAGGGRNYTVFVLRGINLAQILSKHLDSDTMNQVELGMTYQKQYLVSGENTFEDKLGVGKGAYDAWARLSPIRGVNSGDSALDKDRFANLRAEMYWRLREWILGGGRLLTEQGQEDDWLQLSKIKYRTKLESGRGKLQIIPKEQMLRRGIDSPDAADALALTFASPDDPSPLYAQAETSSAKPAKDFDPYFKKPTA